MISEAERYRREKARLPVPDEVYHASPDSSLKQLEPRVSTHGAPWVYAAIDLALSATQLSSWGGDFSCWTGRYGDRPIHVCERFPGAFDRRYAHRSGSIYVLPGKTFRRGKTSFTEEVVSEVSVWVLREIDVPDVKAYLLQLEQETRLRILYYPERFPGIPEDDQDLVDRAVMGAQQPGNRVLEFVREYHSHLVERILAGIERAKSSAEEENSECSSEN